VLGIDPRAAADRPDRERREGDRDVDPAVDPVGGGDRGTPLNDVRRVLPAGDEDGGDDVCRVGVEPERGRPRRAHQILPVVDLDEGRRIGLQEVGDHRVGEPDARDHGLPPAPDQVDRRRFLVGAHVPGEGDEPGAGLPFDQFADFLACDRHHVHAHGVPGLELEPDKDAGARDVGPGVEEPPVFRGALRGRPDLSRVPLYPGGHVVGVADVAGGEDRRPGHPVPHDPHVRTARPGDQGAPAVHRGDERPFGRGEREVVGPGSILALHPERPRDTKRHLYRADHVLDVALHHPVDIDGERPHRGEGGVGLALDECSPHPDRFFRRKLLLERVEFEGAVFQPPDVIIHE